MKIFLMALFLRETTREVESATSLDPTVNIPVHA